MRPGPWLGALLVAVLGCRGAAPPAPSPRAEAAAPAPGAPGVAGIAIPAATGGAAAPAPAAQVRSSPPGDPAPAPLPAVPARAPESPRLAGPARAAAPTRGAALSACCQQCLDASGRDPSGFDLSVSPCARYGGEYNGAPGVSPACVALFEAQGTTVGQCRAVGQ